MASSSTRWAVEPISSFPTGVRRRRPITTRSARRSEATARISSWASRPRIARTSSCSTPASVNLQAFDLGLLLVLGLLGFGMRRFGLPVLPLILGVILGPRLEEELRKSLQLSDGQLSGLFNEPVAVVVYVIGVIVLAWPLVARLARRSPAVAKAVDGLHDDVTEQEEVGHR